MKIKIKLVIALIFLATIAILFIPAKVSSVPAPVDEEPSLRMPPATEAEYKQRLEEIAEEKGLAINKVEEIKNTIGGVPGTACPNGESTWKADARGDGGTSIGLAQIHLPAHPHITEEEALDAEFSLNFMVDEFKAGNEWKWTCWREIYL